MIVDPSGCASYIIDGYGDKGRAWLQALPALIAAYAERWSLRVLPPFSGLSYNYVTPALRADGTPVVIKAGVPNPEIRQEIEALRFINGNGMARLLDADPENGVLLLERLIPGTPLSELTDEEAVTHIMGGVLSRLWKPVSGEHNFATVRGWVAGFNRLRERYGGSTGPLPEHMISTAEAVYAELTAGSPAEILLHGDPHPKNVLQAEREPWLAIDPKGVLGDPAYDLATFVNSIPYQNDDAQWLRAMYRRASQLGDQLSFDPRLILRWALVHSVLSGWWHLEDHGRGWEESFYNAQLLQRALK